MNSNIVFLSSHNFLCFTLSAMLYCTSSYALLTFDDMSNNKLYLLTYLLIRLEDTTMPIALLCRSMSQRTM